MNNVYCVIMAGGKGERFWPCSRENTPKQLLNIVGKETLIEQTVLRLIPVVPFENILIITNRKYTEKMRQLLPQLPKENIIGEPCGRDTAPCVALAAGIIRKKAGTEDAVMILMPSDHCIHNVAELQRDLEICCRAAAEKPVLATIGIKPFAPSSDYGYIECGKELGEHLFQVRRFVEKPSREKAGEMLAEGNYKWNSGMFIWRVGTVLEELDKLDRRLIQLKIEREAMKKETDEASKKRLALLEEEITKLEKEYAACRKISIDYAIMEKAENIVVLEASFDWDDIGNWTALRNHFRADDANNVAIGRFEALDARSCIAFSNDPDHLLCAIDTEELIMIHTPDVTLVCGKNSTPKIKQFLKKLAEKEEMKGYF